MIFRSNTFSQDICFILAHLLIASAVVDSASAQPAKPNPFTKSIEKFVEADEKSPPPKDALLFIGSSSIRMWKLDQSFPEKNVINRGFGGSQISDSIEFMEKIVYPYEPSVVLLYAGDNDLAKGKTPDTVFADFKTFQTNVHQKLPKTPVLFIAIKPSIKRWELVEKIKTANSKIKDYADQHQLVQYVDIFEPMLGEDGKPMKELFAKDGLHLSAEGYKLWTKVVDEALTKQE